MKKILIFLAISLLTLTSCKEEDTTVEKVEKEKTVEELLLGKWQLINEDYKDVAECKSKTTVIFDKTSFTSNKYKLNAESDCSSEVIVFSYIINGDYITTVDADKKPVVKEGVIQQFLFSVEGDELKTVTNVVSVFKRI